MPLDHAQPQTIFLKDYEAPAFAVESIALCFDLREKGTRVLSTMTVVRQSENMPNLVLDGDPQMDLLSIKLDGTPLPAGRISRAGEQLTIKDMPASGVLEIEVEIEPQNNARLEGLYKSGGNFCTQCEAQGFRNITFFPDRPDVMTRFTVRIEADKAAYPVLLSNGNRIEQGDLGAGRHFAVWEDPFKKPAYLFALVAGDLGVLSDQFTTRSGRTVALHIYAKARDLPKCQHAMDSLKRAMRWDEEVYGLEYDLDIYNIVAVSDFNMGAMENKSLNIFNTKYVLADPQIATDTDFDNVEGVIAHEYFHNWTGNRVTCRDWFQLSLKEGLTVFRDQEYSADQASRSIKRIHDVKTLRAFQFPEDAGPLAHPIRPDSYIEINNFYTVTVYNKGAEVIRMMHRLLGVEGFRRGMDLYFQRHDGQAVTCDDFVAAMEDANGADLGQFRLWYAQAGTPELTIEDHWEESTGRYELHIKQSVPQTPGQTEKAPMHMPFLLGLIGPNGQEMDAELVAGEGTRHDAGWLLHIRQSDNRYQFSGLGSRPIPSLLRGFSAPVTIKASLNRADKLFLTAHDSDPFARWEACQDVMIETLLDLVKAVDAGQPLDVGQDLIDACEKILEDAQSDPAFAAELMTLPGEAYIGQMMDVVAVDAIHHARIHLRHVLAHALESHWRRLYREMTDTVFGLSPEQKSRRALKNVALIYLAALGDNETARTHYAQSNNMTDRLAALQVLVNGSDDAARDAAFADFYDRFEMEDLAIDKWFALQALSDKPDTLKTVRTLRNHSAFSLRNPNRLRALVGSFASGNQLRFHAVSGEGYAFLSDIVKHVDQLNPQTAARLVLPLIRHERYDPVRAGLMRKQLQALLNVDGLSKDVYEIVSKSLMTKEIS
ncbi:aminopeptidase N [Iodidimonas muriae]|uniref:Aminopeptidase N n=1 Tax=Iodidimonas muriae TaxID=261467 RepID=A0ABQ2LEH8_9PROT|nr:aminopeptidase N [Iodidimonas muriae]GER06953.1 aminopeptidase N [Kordiimonadales bacterium JCM 17843]GGO13614.1 aminopeptidase N [Iodidimonas muriae]